MPSDADQIANLDAELDALDSPTTVQVLAHTQDYDAGIVAASAARRALNAGGDGGGSQPGTVTLETVVVTAAEIVARWDGDSTAAMVEKFTFAVGDAVLSIGFVSTLDAGTVSGGMYFAPSGQSTAVVYATADISAAANEWSAEQADGVQGEAPWTSVTVLTAVRAGYVSVTDVEPTSGDVTVYALIARA